MERRYQGSRDGYDSQRDGRMAKDRTDTYRDGRDLRGNRDIREGLPQAMGGRDQHLPGMKRQGEEGGSHVVR